MAETSTLLFILWALTWRDEEDSSEIFIVGDLQDLPGDIHQPAGHWRNPPEIQDPANHTASGLRIRLVPLSRLRAEIAFTFQRLIFASLLSRKHGIAQPPLHPSPLLLTSRCVRFYLTLNNNSHSPLRVQSNHNQRATLSGCFSNGHPCLSFFSFFLTKGLIAPRPDWGFVEANEYPAERDDTLA